MSYVAKVLEPDEEIRYLAKLSWTAYVPGVLAIVVAIAIAVFGMTYSVDHVFVYGIGALLAAVIGLIGVLMVASAFYQRWTTEIAVTNRRVILKRGLVVRHTIEMNMSKVESVDVAQSILGRILNYGNVTIRGTGSSLEPINGIDNPLAFRSSITSI